jgi:hypothetical protein
MPRLAAEGVVGADAIFACLGPALEIFSRYSHVEKASGETVTLREYLENVWAAIAREAFNTIFEGVDATGFEEDARLTAIWFWVMKTSANGNGNPDSDVSQGKRDNDEQDEEEASSTVSKGYTMDYDGARKLAQGLGVNIQRLSQPGGILVVKGNVARLNGVAERERYLLGQQISLFGSEATKVVKYRREKPPIAKLKKVEQRHEDLFGVTPPAKRNRDQPYFPGFGLQEDGRSKLQLMMDNGSSLLDRLHQAMLLFARSYTALLRPFLVETQMATNPRFWQLAQALAALYPQGSDERRWVEGVLARKKGLGF